jgi:hypothetical protein
MIATGGNFRLSFVRKWVGSGMIRLACNVSPLRDLARSESAWSRLDQY